MNFKDITDFVFKKKEFVVFLIGVNIAASIIGYISYGYFYHVPLAEIHPIFWIIIPDCPNASLFFVFFLVSLLIDRENEPTRIMRILNGIVFIELIRGAILSFMYVMHTTGLYPELVVGLHAGMLLQAIFMLPYLKLPSKVKTSLMEFFAVIAVVAINDMMDFFWNPPAFVQFIDLSHLFDLYMFVAISLDIILLIIFFVAGRINLLNDQKQTTTG
ncbi:MAG: DUF1405 domain-containing protein [Candidatus Odinarchaeota archaeon]